MVSRVRHGGECCGINHIFNFGLLCSKDALASLDYEIAIRKQRRRSGLMEIVLTDIQALSWDERLIQRGFIRVNRFLNSNSGNWCNIYHLRTGQNWFKDAYEDGVMNAVAFYFWQRIKDLFFISVAVGSVFAIQQAVYGMQRIM